MAKTTADLREKKHVLLGRYDDEPIVWRILEHRPEGVLIVSCHVLDVMSFDSTSKEAPYGCNRWRDSTLRYWLNSTAGPGEVDFGPHPPPTADRLYTPDHWEFDDDDREEHAYADAAGFLHQFTEAELGALAVLSLETPQRAQTEERDHTEDRVFLPLAREVEEWFWAGWRPAQYDGTDWGWWTREPQYTGSTVDDAVTEIEAGGHWGYWYAAAPAPGIRPIVLLRAGLEFEGTGTAKKPYRLI